MSDRPILIDPLAPSKAALIAASQATEAAAALLTFVREHDEYPRPDLDPEACVVEKLAEATMRSIEISDPDFEDESLRQLHGALTRFLEGWA